MSDKQTVSFPAEPNGDIPIVPGMGKLPSRQSKFFQKHKRALETGYMSSHPDVVDNYVKRERINLGIGLGVIVSIFLNLIQAHHPVPHQLIVSLDNDTHDIIHTTTMPYPLNSTQIVRNWAEKTLCSAMSVSFATYQETLDANRKNFTEAGYAGFLLAMKEWDADILKNQLIVSVVPDGPSVIMHMPTMNELYWTIQIPIVMTFTAGNDASTRTVHTLATLNVVPIYPHQSIEGHAIDSMFLG